MPFEFIIISTVNRLYYDVVFILYNGRNQHINNIIKMKMKMKWRWIECCHFLFITTHWFYSSSENRTANESILQNDIVNVIWFFVSPLPCRCCCCCCGGGICDYDQPQNVPRMTKWLKRALFLILSDNDLGEHRKKKSLWKTSNAPNIWIVE